MSGTMEFGEFAAWAKQDARCLDWLDLYVKPLREFLDNIEIESADLRRPDGGAGFGLELTTVLQTVFQKELQGCETLKEAQFTKMMTTLSKLKASEQTRTFCKRLFHFFDCDGGGDISWEELIAGVHLVTRGSKVDRLRCVFVLIDRKGKGSINRRELREFIELFWFHPLERVGKAPDLSDPTLFRS